MNKKNPTIIDVAKLANVGTMSVSRFLKIIVSFTESYNDA